MRSLILFIFAPVLFFAQSVKRPLLNANSFYYKKHCYVYGYTNEKGTVHFKLYKLSNDLSKTDSVQFALAKDKIENYLDISADTLHNYLNFYFQKTNSKKLASLIRLNDSLRLITKVENFDVTKVNRMASFDEEKYNYGNSIYTVRSSADSTGLQYYLNKFDVVDVKKPFEYMQSWQFPLEKQNVNTVHIFYADSQLVFLYATILTGNNKGEWVLKIDASNGTLIRGKRISIKGDSRNFLMSGHYYNKEKKELLVLGNVFTEAQVNYTSKTYTFAGLNKSNTFFFVVLDSTNEVITREEKPFPIKIENLKPDAKTVLFYHFKIKDIQKVSKSEFAVYCDIYKSIGQSLMFMYETGFTFNFTYDEPGSVEFTAEKIYSNTNSLPGLITTDEKDINGKMDLKSITDLDKLFYKTPLADVEVLYGKDDVANPKWILKKTDIKTSNTTFYKVKMGAKAIESSVLLENTKYTRPNVYKIKNDVILLFNYDSNSSMFELNLKNWL